MILLLCGIKKNDMNYLQNRNRLTDKENKLLVTKGERWAEKYKFGIWDEHKHSTVYKIDKQQDYCIAQGTLLNSLETIRNYILHMQTSN